MAAARGAIVAAPSSGSGKTTVTLGALGRLAAAGAEVASFKVGPDYIDPAFHEAATGRPCPNLDSWAMRPELLAALYGEAAAGADFVVGEGVMGLFDGAEGGAGSTAELAALLGLPVILVVDAAAQGQSAAAVVHGLATWRSDVRVSGVVYNRVGSARHAGLLREASAPLGVPVLGCIPRAAAVAVPDRHLGLVQARELGGLDGVLAAAAALVGEHVDLAALEAALAAPADGPGGPGGPGGDPPEPVPPLGQRIAVASDEAFGFSYRHVTEGWRRAGAEVVPFSPLADAAPDTAADAVYLPGGYPELHAGTLAGNRRFLDGLAAAAGRGAAVYGECGGYMVLGRALTDAGGEAHAMAGLLPVETSFAERRLHLGYRRVALAAPGPLGPARRTFRAHEFHYATARGEGVGDALFTAPDVAGAGGVGTRRGAVMGSFMHVIDTEPRPAAR